MVEGVAQVGVELGGGGRHRAGPVGEADDVAEAGSGGGRSDLGHGSRHVAARAPGHRLTGRRVARPGEDDAVRHPGGPVEAGVQIAVMGGEESWEADQKRQVEGKPAEHRGILVGEEGWDGGREAKCNE